MKVCSKCGTNKQDEAFSKKASAKDGLQSRCKQCMKEYSAAYGQQNRVKRKAYKKKYYSENKGCIITRVKSYYQQNKSHKLKYAKNYYSLPENKERSRECHRKRRKERMTNDLDFKAATAIRRMLHRTIRQIGGRKEASTVELLGYTARQLADHLSEQFVEGMNWENHGEWHIDHIKPISKFVEEGESGLSIINALTNLQPLWAADNIAKGNKWPY